MKKILFSFVLLLIADRLVAQAEPICDDRGIFFSYKKRIAETVENPKTGTKFTKWEIITQLYNSTDKEVVVVINGSGYLSVLFDSDRSKLSEEDNRFCMNRNTSVSDAFLGNGCKFNIMCPHKTAFDIPKYILTRVGEEPKVARFNMRVAIETEKPEKAEREPYSSLRGDEAIINRPDKKTNSNITEPTDKSVVLPAYPGGMRAFGLFISENLQYPVADMRGDVQGKANISFVVNTDGSLTDVEVVSAPSKTIGAEALRVIKLSPKWIPGTKNGVPVRVRHTIPINFALTVK